MTIIERLECNSEWRSACKVWTGSCDRQGYGRFSLKGRMFKAHRIAYEIHVGPIPGGLCVLHRCDNPPCVTPEHLWLGTVADNNKDAAAKGRSRNGGKGGCPGNTNGATLSESDVLQIRHRARYWNTPQVALAEQFNVSQSNISLILGRKIWKDVPVE